MIFFTVSIFDPRIALAAIVCMGGPIVTSFFTGRFWCGNLCPRGGFYDTVAVKLSAGRQVPKFLKWLPFRYVIVVFLLTTFGKGILENRGNLSGMGMVFYRIIAVTTLLGILLAFFFNERAWCNFCPMGTLSNLISQLNNNRKVLNVAPNCVSCKACGRICPMGISADKFRNGNLYHPDCIQCGKCVHICPKKSIKYKK